MSCQIVNFSRNKNIEARLFSNNTTIVQFVLHFRLFGISFLFISKKQKKKTAIKVEKNVENATTLDVRKEESQRSDLKKVQMLIRRPPQMEQGLVVLNPNVDKNMFFIIIRKIFNSGVWSMEYVCERTIQTKGTYAIFNVCMQDLYTCLCV